MSFPRYPKYKASGVEWLGQVPEHWVVTKLKRVVNPERQITYGIVQAGPHIPDGVPYIRPADMADEQGVTSPDDVLRTSPEVAGAYSRSTVRTGDLICSIGPSFGKVMVTPSVLDGANLTQGTARIAIQRPHNARYIFWTLRSSASVAQWESSVGGATFRALNLGPLAETHILVPNEAEQTNIAAFLDRETAKIDELVAEQRRLVDLLKEKRQAVISHAVTKGLNAHAPMKPSGIDWLGDVPAHWKVEKIKYLVRSIEQGWSPQCEGFPAESETEWGVLKVGCVNGGTFNPTENKMLPEELEPVAALAIIVGDLLISRANTRELVGSAAVAGRDYPNLMLCDKLYRLRFHADLGCPKFVSYYLGSSAVRGQIELEATGASASMVNIGQSAIMELAIAVPGFEEQRGIVAFLEREVAGLNILATQAQCVIDLLEERRTALISAAVTGQIDVRELAVAQAA